jgi:hypothetical protein
MATTMGELLREFVLLNYHHAVGTLPAAKQQRWGDLAEVIDGELARFEARAQGLVLRRRATRARLHLPVRFLSAAVLGAGETVDLSCCGCALNTSAALRAGDEIELTVHLPGRFGSLHPTGRVCWSVPGATFPGYQAGVAFAAVDELEREALASCVLGKVAPFFAAKA